MPGSISTMSSEKYRKFPVSYLLKLPAVLLLSLLTLFSVSCKDIVFNNPLDPDASKDVVTVVRVVDTSLADRGDIAYDGEKFWKTSPFGNLTAFDRESGTIIRSFISHTGTGVAFFNDSIYLCGTGTENLLFIVDPLSGDTLNRISTRDLFPAFLAANGFELILYDQRSAGVFQYDPETGESLRLFGISGVNIGGIAMYKGGLLLVDTNTDSLYRFALTGDVLDVYSSPAAGISGVAVDESDYVYLLTLDGKVYKVSLP